MSGGSRQSVAAYTDGAAKGNPGPAGWAWWISDDEWDCGNWDRATNNVAELTAVAQLLAAFTDQPHLELTIVCDSRYVIDCVTKWVHGWKRNGWRTKAGTPVANGELISEIDALITARGGVTFRWQRGHVGAHGNTQADARASAAATAAQRRTACPVGPGPRHPAV